MKNLLIGLIILLNLISLRSQHDQYWDISYGGDVIDGNSERVLWDIHFDYNLTAATFGEAGMAGVVFFGNEFWVSKWASDSIVKLNNSGVVVSEFIIPGLTGIRALSTNDSYIFAANNTNTIYRINPITMTLAPPHITIPIASTRYCAYDPTLDGGLGGFWIGNFSTDLTAINMSGVALTTIPSATHGLSGMYGTSVDNTTAGGPFLWVFHQEGANNCQLSQLQLPSGIPTGLTHDVFPDFSASNSLTSGLAGGIHISTLAVPGNVTLMGVMQGTPNNVLFGYDLEAPPVGASDISVNNLRTNFGYTKIPMDQVVADSILIELQNTTATIIDSVIVNIEVEHTSSVVYSEQIVLLNYPAYGSSTIYSQSYLPNNGLGDYKVKVSTNTSITEPDLTPVNDTASFIFALTDSVFARDNGVPDGGAGYVVSSTEWAYAVTYYHLFNPDTISGVWIQLAAPIDGDTTYAVIANMAGGIPTTVVATSPIYLTSAVQSTYFLQFPGGIALPAGDYVFGCYESAITNNGLAQSSDVFTPGMNFYYLQATGWTASGVNTARFIHPIFEYTPSSTAISDEANISTMKVYPNPSTGIFFVDGNLNFGNYQLLDMSGRVLKTGYLLSNNSMIDISTLQNGTYILKVIIDGTPITKSIIKI